MTDAVFPLTLTQSDIYLDQSRRTHSPLYNVGGYIQLGPINVDRLIDAHERLIREDDVFGIRIQRAQGRIVQTINADKTTALPVLDFSGKQHPVEAAEIWQKTVFETPFAVHDSELYRVFLLKLASDYYRYVGVAHHLIMDGWGFSNWAKRLCQFYNDPCGAVQATTSWREIASQDEKYLESEKYKAGRDYWIQQVRQSDPLFKPRHVREFQDPFHVPSRRRIIHISRSEFNELAAVSEKAGAGVAHHFLALLAVYFWNTSGRTRLNFGLPFHNRKGSSQKRMLGVFTSISPLCIDLGNGEFTFGDLVRNIASRQKASFRYQRYPLGHIVRDLGGVSHSRAIYDVGFNYLRIGGELSFEGNAELNYVSHNHEPAPLMVTLCEYGELGPLELQLDYNLAYFNDADSQMLAERLSFLVQSLREAYTLRVADLEILPEQEVCSLLRGHGDAPLPPVPDVCIHHLFEEQVQRSPEAIAVTSHDGSLTYGELNARANRVAHYLIAVGVKPESLVGVFMERGADMLAAVLGILKAGGAYVPLDPKHPPQRIKAMIEEDGIRFIVGDDQFRKLLNLEDSRFIAVDEALADITMAGVNLDLNTIGDGSSNLAYVIYTSGSTGKPKGVQICHGNTVSFLRWVHRVYTPEDLARVLASTSLSFDLSVFEMFAPLSIGGRCVIVKDALELLAAQADVTLINTVPSAIKALIEQNAIPPTVRIVNLAGEPLPMQVVNDLLEGRRCRKVFNLYGPSEDTTYSTYALFEAPLSEPPNIGRAIAGTSLYVLSAAKKLAPTGEAGELHIAGSGLCRGYLNRPDLTAEKFSSDPFSRKAGERMYATGDLVRYREDGALEYLGRADDQVKIRGFRVEPGEIAHCLEQLDGIKTAAVIARESASGKYLAAYVERQQNAATDSTLDNEMWIERLRPALRKLLPEYMVPAVITVLDEMPLTSNGKINKKALLALQENDITESQYVAPATATEIRIVELWANLLGIDEKKISINTNLFDLGGHSLLLIQLANQIRVESGVDIPMRKFYEMFNIRDLAAQIDTEAKLQRIEKAMAVLEAASEGYL